MTRETAWSLYFTTGETEPLIKSYWDSIGGIAWSKEQNNAHDREDAFQWGMIGLLKAIKTIDLSRVKSKDAWVWLNVSHMMLNHWKKNESKTVSLDEEIFEGTTRGDEIPGAEYDVDLRIDLLDILDKSATLGEVKSRLIDCGLQPNVVTHVDHYLNQYKDGTISLSHMARELGISRRQANKLIGKPRKN